MHLVKKYDFSICDLMECDLLLPWPYDMSSVILKEVLCTIDLAASKLRQQLAEMPKVSDRTPS